jgi:hypothetical protein
MVGYWPLVRRAGFQRWGSPAGLPEGSDWGSRQLGLQQWYCQAEADRLGLRRQSRWELPAARRAEAGRLG